MGLKNSNSSISSGPPRDAKNVTHSQSVDGRAEPAILAEFREARWFELWSAFARLGLRYLSGGAQEQIIISVAAICPHSKENKESLNLAYGLTRLRCLVRVSLGLKYKQVCSSVPTKKLGNSSLWRETSPKYPIAGGPLWRYHVRTGTSQWRLTRVERDWWTQPKAQRGWLNPTLRAHEQRT